MQLLAEGLKEVKKKKGAGVSRRVSAIICSFFSLSEGYEGERRKILFGRCALRNPCRHKSWHHQICSAAVSPSPPTSLHMCFLVLTADWERERDKTWDEWISGRLQEGSVRSKLGRIWWRHKGNLCLHHILKKEKDTRRLKNQARSIVRGQMTTSDLHPNQPLSCTSIIHT